MTVLVRKAMPVSRSIWLAASIGGMFVLSAASHGYAAPPVGGARVELAEAIVHTVQGRAHDRGTLYRPPQTIKPPPSPRVRDHRGEQQKFKAPEVFCGRGRPPCSPKGNVRDHRSR
jgi:hypothetical protein